MGIFSRKKKPAMMDLPPPPSPEEVTEDVKAPKMEAVAPKPRRSVKKYDIPPPPDILMSKPGLKGDIPSIRGAPKHAVPPELPPMPEFPAAEEAMPELPPEVEEIKREAVVGVRKDIEPIFVEVGDYQAIIDRSKTIRNTLKEAEDTVIRLGTLKSEEEKIISNWKKQLEDIEKKISYVDEVVFGGE